MYYLSVSSAVSLASWFALSVCVCVHHSRASSQCQSLLYQDVHLTRAPLGHGEQ